MEQFSQYLTPELQTIITVIVAIIAAIGQLRKKQYREAMLLIVESIGFNKEENKELKEVIKEKAKEKGINLITARVDELKRRNKTANIIIKTGKFLKDFIF